MDSKLRVVKPVKKILVADDEKGCRELLALQLEQNGYEVIEAMDGYQAVQLAKKEKPHLIILDIMMPRMGGDDANLLLLDDPRTKNIPVIFLSSLQTRRQETEHGGEVQGRTILAKPVNMKILLAKLKEILGGP